MGNAASAQLQAVAALSGAAPLPLDAPEWAHLLGYASPLSRFDPGEVEREIRPHCAELVYNNAHTLNLQRFIYLAVQRLRRARLNPAGASGAATANALYCLRTILKDLMEQLNSEQLLAFVEVPRDVAAAAAAAAEAQQQQQQQQGEGGEASPAPSQAGGALAPREPEFGQLHGGSLVQTLVREAALMLADRQLLPSAHYPLLLECAQLLLVAASTALYSPAARGAPGQHPFLEAAMRQGDLANPLLEALLALFVAALPVPLSLKIAPYVPTDTRSVLRIVRSAAASVLWLPYQAYTLLLRPGRAAAPGEGGAAAAPSASPLGDAAALLLLVLLFHAPPQDAPYGNPYRSALRRLQDADDLGSVDAAEGGRGGAGGDAAVGYAPLFDALGAALTSERAVLLLYALLHGCPRFHEYCLVRSDLDTLLLPLLQLLYSAQERTANQMYMLLIILLMLSQDASFAQNVHTIALPSVPFYRERSATRTTLGSLLVVLLLRTAHYNLAKLRDVYLHTNTLAALANLAPHMSGLSTHASQRLVSLFHLLARRHARLQAAAEGGPPPTPSLPPGPQPSLNLDSPLTPWSPPPPPPDSAAAALAPPQGPHQQAAVAVAAAGAAAAAAAAAAGGGEGGTGAAAAEGQELELQLYADFLRIVLEIINSILTSALPQNPELVYTLLHRQEVFAPFAAHPRYAELAENIRRVVDFFNRRVEESVAASGEPQLSVERLLELIKHHSRGWRRDRLRPFPELRFTYEEEASPEEFFVPYVWSLVVAMGGIPFTLPAIQLFTPTVVPEPAAEEPSPAPSPHPRGDGEAAAPPGAGGAAAGLTDAAGAV